MSPICSTMRAGTKYKPLSKPARALSPPSTQSAFFLYATMDTSLFGWEGLSPPPFGQWRRTEERVFWVPANWGLERGGIPSCPACWGMLFVKMLVQFELVEVKGLIFKNMRIEEKTALSLGETTRHRKNYRKSKIVVLHTCRRIWFTMPLAARASYWSLKCRIIIFIAE